MFSRKEQVLFLDDKPIGPTDCANGSPYLDAMSVRGVVESPLRALVYCVRPKGPLTIARVAPKETLVKVWWYAYAETGKMLVGPGENGPLHWQ